mgnify:CR=1 FL=1
MINYIAIRGDADEVARTKKLLYARYGVEAGGDLGRVLADGSIVFEVVGAGIGHLKADLENLDKTKN